MHHYLTISNFDVHKLFKLNCDQKNTQMLETICTMMNKRTLVEGVNKFLIKALSGSKATFLQDFLLLYISMSLLWIFVG